MSKQGREQVVDLLMTIEKEGTYAQLLLKEALEQAEMKDRGFITEVVYGTLKYQIRLDYILNQYSKTPVVKMKPFIRQILRSSSYQLLFLDKIPASAVINEAVKMVKKRKFQNLSGFVNAVLRTIDRQREQISYPSPQKNPSLYLSVYYAFPEWMIKKWLTSYGFLETERLCQALNHKARVCIRVNDLKADNQLLRQLEKEGVEVKAGHLLKEAYYLEGVRSLQNMVSFKEGKWTVQDESAMLVAHVADPKPGDNILDMCSAPGGKAMHLADRMKNKGRIISCDVHPHKLELIDKQKERLGCSIIETRLQDGTVFNPEFKEAFDIVVLDVPCSGLGILKRKPDMRHHRKASDIEHLNHLQKELVKNAIAYIKPGGRLIYSTCTICDEENQEMLKWMQANYPIKEEPIAHLLPECLREKASSGSIQILPQDTDTDGFFIARLIKENKENE